MEVAYMEMQRVERRIMLHDALGPINNANSTLSFVDIDDDSDDESEPPSTQPRVVTSEIHHEDAAAASSSQDLSPEDRGIFTEPLFQDTQDFEAQIASLPPPLIPDRSRMPLIDSSSSISTLSSPSPTESIEDYDSFMQNVFNQREELMSTSDENSPIMRDDEQRLRTSGMTRNGRTSRVPALSSISILFGTTRRRNAFSPNIPACRKRLVDELKKSKQDEKNCRKNDSSSAVENDLKQCVVCFEREYDIVIRPCNHLSTCNSCAAKLDKCPTCRGPLVDFLKVFPA
jgi:hypothetical protein